MKPLPVSELMDRLSRIDPKNLSEEMLKLDEFPTALALYRTDRDLIQEVRLIYKLLAEHLQMKSTDAQDLMHAMFDMLGQTIKELAVNKTLLCMN